MVGDLLESLCMTRSDLPQLSKSLELRQMELLFSHRAPITLPMDRQRDLTVALADLLLNAATNKCGEPTPDAQREVEDAPEADD